MSYIRFIRYYNDQNGDTEKLCGIPFSRNLHSRIKKSNHERNRIKKTMHKKNPFPCLLFILNFIYTIFDSYLPIDRSGNATVTTVPFVVEQIHELAGISPWNRREITIGGRDA